MKKFDDVISGDGRVPDGGTLNRIDVLGWWD